MFPGFSFTLMKERKHLYLGSKKNVEKKIEIGGDKMSVSITCLELGLGNLCGKIFGDLVLMIVGKSP